MRDLLITVHIICEQRILPAFKGSVYCIYPGLYKGRIDPCFLKLLNQYPYDKALFYTDNKNGLFFHVILSAL